MVSAQAGQVLVAPFKSEKAWPQSQRSVPGGFSSLQFGHSMNVSQSILTNVFPRITIRFLQAGQSNPSADLPLVTPVPHHGHLPFNAPSPIRGPNKGAITPPRIMGTPTMAPMPVKQRRIPRGMRQPDTPQPAMHPASAPWPLALRACVVELPRAAVGRAPNE